MSPKSSDSLKTNAQDPSPMSAPGPKDVSPGKTQEIPSTESVISPQPSSSDQAASPFSPADCRTLEKILAHVQSPSPATPSARCISDIFSASTDLTPDGSSDTGIVDEVTYAKKRYDYGDEVEDGYEDEDDSMELSEPEDTTSGVREVGERTKITAPDEYKREYVWSDGNTIEDIMNLPGQTAPPAPRQDLDGVYAHEQPTPEPLKEIKQRRAVLDSTLNEERVKQERETAATLVDEDAHITASSLEVESDAVDGDELEYFEPFDRRTSRQFSRAPISRRASADALMPHASANFTVSRPAVVMSPSGKHLDFASYAAVPDTPFAKMLDYFKQSKGKENSPSNNRRNASLSEEIAELAREANEESNLEIYREMDLAPMEPVMESDTAGNHITFGTPVRSNISSMTFGSDIFSPQAAAFEDLVPEDKPTAPLSAVTATTEDLEGDAYARLSHTETALSQPAQENETKDSGNTSKSLGKAVVEKEIQDTQSPQQPPFITIIGLLPQAMFWVAAAPVVKYSNKAYEALVDGFAKLPFGERGASRLI